VSGVVLALVGSLFLLGTVIEPIVHRFARSAAERSLVQVVAGDSDREQPSPTEGGDPDCPVCAVAGIHALLPAGSSPSPAVGAGPALTSGVLTEWSSPGVLHPPARAPPTA